MASSVAAQSFDRLAADLQREYLSWDPALATQVGVHDYDHLLRDPSRRAISRETESMSEYLTKLEVLKTEELSPSQNLDREFAIHLLELRRFELCKLKKYEKGSFAASELGNSLFFLFTRKHLSDEERLESITARIRSAPEFLERSRETVTTPYRLWNEILYETGERMPRFLRELRDDFESVVTSPQAIGQLDRAIKEAVEALDEYNSWMKKEIIPNSANTTSIGPELYREYLEIQKYGVTAEETLAIAQKHLEKVNRQKSSIAEKMASSPDASLAIRKMRADHASDFEGVLNEYRESVQKARDFVRLKDLVTIPQRERLLVVPTPSFMAHVVPYAAQYEPGKFDGDTTGQFLVTPTQGNPAILEEHNRISIVNTSVHEGYPGHHLHGVCANLNPSRLRVLYSSPDFGEGWGLYCEDMMISQGYNDSLMGRLTVLNDLTLRIARQICDVKISMGEMNIQQAADLLVRETGTDSSAAMSEAKAMTLSPTYYAAYFIGKLGVLQMRDDSQALLGDRFSLKFFHDALIYSGCMPMPFMRRALSQKISEKFGVNLGPPRESLLSYSNRILAG